MVLGAHLAAQQDANQRIAIYLPHTFIGIWARCGWAGVDLFFVLSGFLVSGLLFNEYKKHGKVEVGRFLIRRGFKIYPAFYVFLLSTLGIDLFLRFVRHWREVPGIGAPGFGAYLCEALFVQNYGLHTWPHTWSLAVEEHFYLLLGLGVFLLSRRFAGRADNPFSFIPYFFIFAVPALLVVKLINVHLHPPSLYPDGGWRCNCIFTHLRFDSLLFGVVLSYISIFHTEETALAVKRYSLIILVSSCMLVSICGVISQWTAFMYTIGFCLLYLGFGGLVMLMIHWDIGTSRLAGVLKPIGLIGYYSYSIYLWHFAVRVGCDVLEARFFGRHAISPTFGAIAYVAGSILVGIAAAKIVEVPFLRLRDRLFPSRAVG
jgi:peptidoglycan/LPS O-acetylase OafA/YrhL